MKSALLDPFFQQLAAASNSVLFLDYDGTMAPFRVERDQAVPYPGVREILNRIMAAGRSRVVVISGRAVDDVLPLLGLNTPPEIWGSHGWERRHADGRRQLFEIERPAHQGLSRGEQHAREATVGSRVETKPGCVAVHWRGVSAAEQALLRQRVEPLWQELASGGGLAVKEFDGGLELRVPGRHKGLAVDAVLREMEPGTMAAYLGDDWTDEDAFRALGSRGLSVLVRRESRPTAAALQLIPPKELLEFLERWERVVGG